LKFQGQIDATARAQKSGANLLYDPAAGKVVFTLPAAQLAQNFSGTMTLYRANAPELDREFLLQPRADGTQTFDVSKLATGPWRLRAAWVADGTNYFLEEKIIVTGR
ncbi:MAG: FixH family protein, partial [Verrucomicrobiota bacterium]